MKEICESLSQLMSEISFIDPVLKTFEQLGQKFPNNMTIGKTVINLFLKDPGLKLHIGEIFKIIVCARDSTQILDQGRVIRSSQMILRKPGAGSDSLFSLLSTFSDSDLESLTIQILKTVNMFIS